MLVKYNTCIGEYSLDLEKYIKWKGNCAYIYYVAKCIYPWSLKAVIVVKDIIIKDFPNIKEENITFHDYKKDENFKSLDNNSFVLKFLTLDNLNKIDSSFKEIE